VLSSLRKQIPMHRYYTFSYSFELSMVAITGCVKLNKCKDNAFFLSKVVIFCLFNKGVQENPNCR